MFILVAILLVMMMCLITTFRRQRRRRLRANVVCSLTTIPERIQRGTLKKTLDSIHNQSLQPRVTYIHVPRFTAKNPRPYDLHALHRIADQYDGRVRINVIERDLGPISKLVPVIPLLRPDDDFVFLVDDDVSYHPSTLETLVASGYSDAVGLAARDHDLNFLINAKRPHKVPFIETFAGALYSTNVLRRTNPSLAQFNESLGNTCFGQDDIKIGKFLQIHKIDPVLLAHTQLSIHDAQGTPQLNAENVHGTGNRECFQTLFTTDTTRASF